MLNRREAIAAGLALAAPRPRDGTPRGKRVVSRLNEDGYVEVIGWGDIRPGDWCMINDWDQQGRLEGMDAFVAMTSPEDDANETIQCEPTSLDWFWQEARERRDHPGGNKPTIYDIRGSGWRVTERELNVT